jgi:hypothetical protein
MGMTTAAPIQVGPSIQISGAFVTNRVKFNFASAYSQLLRDSARDMALLYDADTKRGWIVPKLSLLLYMCQRHVVDRGEASGVPTVPGHTNPGAILPFLDGQGERIVYGGKVDGLRLRTLMMGLNMNMMSMAEKTESPSGSWLHGFEFLDIIDSPGNGAWMRKAKIRRDSGNWTRLAEFASVVVFGGGFGDVIRPSSAGWCRNIDPMACITVPGGSDYLTMPIHCITQLLGRQYGRIEDSEDRYVKLADRVYWIASGLDFEKCCSPQGSATSCWKREETFQRLGSSRLWRKTPPECKFSIVGLPTGGAIVFGRPMRAGTK